MRRGTASKGARRRGKGNVGLLFNADFSKLTTYECLHFSVLIQIILCNFATES